MRLTGRLASATLAAAPSFAVAAFLVHPAIPNPLKAEAALLLAITVIRPAIGLLVVAAAAPLGELAVPLLGARPVRHAETLVMAFLAGWLLARAFASEVRKPALATHAKAAVWVFTCILLGSVATTLFQLHASAPGRFSQVAADLLRGYLVTDEPAGVHQAASLLEGIGLLVAVTTFARRNDLFTLRIAVVLVASGVVVSVASGLLATGIGPAATLARQTASGMHRFSAAQPDVNAAASASLLPLALSIGLAVAVPRGRLLAAAAAVVLSGALALAGSRAALVAVGFVIACGAAVRFLNGRKARIAAFVVVASAAGLVLLSVLRSGDSVALDMRYGFTRASMRMIAARPVFGVGEGRYYALSSLALPPRLAWWYGRENAHDYFLQTAAELGVAGFTAFVWMLVALYAPATRMVWGARAGAVAAAAVGGTAAYLATCLSGHPLLVPETAVPFWLVLGIVVAGAPTAEKPVRTIRWAGAAFAAAVLATVPFRPGPPTFRGRSADEGWGPWQTDANGTKFRLLRSFASLPFVTEAATVAVPMRARFEGSATSGTISINAADLGARHVVLGREWSVVTLALPDPEPLVPGLRLNLAVIRGSATDAEAIEIAQPRIVTTR